MVRFLIVGIMFGCYSLAAFKTLYWVMGPGPGKRNSKKGRK